MRKGLAMSAGVWEFRADGKLKRHILRSDPLDCSFQAPGTAGNASITVNGASVTTFGASGGLARFDYSSSAGTASFVINGGSNGGPGGRLEFARGATADQASIV